MLQLIAPDTKSALHNICTNHHNFCTTLQYFLQISSPVRWHRTQQDPVEQNTLRRLPSTMFTIPWWCASLGITGATRRYEMSNTEYDLNHHTHKKSHHAGNEITYPSNTRTFTSNDAFLNHQRVTAIRMGVASFLALTLFTIIITLPASDAYESTNEFVLDQILFRLD